jgi:hypothetical protein
MSLINQMAIEERPDMDPCLSRDDGQRFASNTRFNPSTDAP